MTDQYAYARFWRCALQVNPVGYIAYRGSEHGLNETGYNQALLAKCLELDIKVVGLADHGSVDSVDILRNTLVSKGIIVFPGFEIASTEKIHMVCLFPEGTTKDQLNRYLGSLQLTDLEEKVRPSRLGCIQLAETIRELGGFWYAAHATHAKGRFGAGRNIVEDGLVERLIDRMRPFISEEGAEINEGHAEHLFIAIRSPRNPMLRLKDGSAGGAGEPMW
jgi:PHP family Zn ribbon phosphoesterase